MNTDDSIGTVYPDSTTSVAPSPGYGPPVHQPTVPVSFPAPVTDRRSFSVRLTAAIAAVAFVLGAGAALLVGMLTGGPGGAGGPGPGGTPPGATSSQVGGSGSATTTGGSTGPST